MLTLSPITWISVISAGVERSIALEQFDEFDLPLARPQDAGHLPGPGVERGEQVQRAFAHVLVLKTYGLVRGAGWTGR